MGSPFTTNPDLGAKFRDPTNPLPSFLFVFCAKRLQRGGATTRVAGWPLAGRVPLFDYLHILKLSGFKSIW